MSVAKFFGISGSQRYQKGLWRPGLNAAALQHRLTASADQAPGFWYKKYKKKQPKNSNTHQIYNVIQKMNQLFDQLLIGNDEVTAEDVLQAKGIWQTLKNAVGDTLSQAQSVAEASWFF